MRRIVVMGIVWLTVLTGIATAAPVWLESAVREANHNGYQIVETAQLQALLESQHDAVVLDARPDYEFRQGHIPGALNLEFDLGDQQRLSAQKKKALKALFGEDTERLVIIYCRDVR